MNCDQAFAAMTDPQLADAGELHRHLESCPRCRQMRETLEPALGRLAVSAAGQSRLSESRGDAAVSLSAVHMARRVAARLSHGRPASAGALRRPVSNVWSYLASAACGALVAVGAITLLQNSATPPALASECLWQDRDAASIKTESSAVVLSCVACHMSPSLHTPLPDEWSNDRRPAPESRERLDLPDSRTVRGA